MFGALKRGFRSTASLIFVRNVGELRPKRTLAASRGFLAAARLSCYVRDDRERNGNETSKPLLCETILHLIKSQTNRVESINIDIQRRM